MHRGVGEAGVGAAQGLGDLGVAGGEALDVQLVEDGAAPDDLGARVALPVEVVVHHHAAGHAGGGVALVHALHAVDEHVADERRVPVDLAGEGAGVGVDEELVRVEAQAPLGHPGAVGAKAVEGARREGGHVAVEDVVGLLEERQAGEERVRVVRVEQAEHQLGGVLGGDGEVDAVTVPRSAQGVRDAGPDREVLHGNRALREEGRAQW